MNAAIYSIVEINPSTGGCMVVACGSSQASGEKRIAQARKSPRARIEGYAYYMCGAPSTVEYREQGTGRLIMTNVSVGVWRVAV